MGCTYDLGDDGHVGSESVEIEGVRGDTVVDHGAFGKYAAEEGEGER